MGVTFTACGVERAAVDDPLLLRQTAMLALQTDQRLAMGSLAGLQLILLVDDRAGEGLSVVEQRTGQRKPGKNLDRRPAKRIGLPIQLRIERGQLGGQPACLLLDIANRSRRIMSRNKSSDIARIGGSFKRPACLEHPVFG